MSSKMDNFDGNCSDSDSIDTMELLKQSAEIAVLDTSKENNDDETQFEDDSQSLLESVNENNISSRGVVALAESIETTVKVEEKPPAAAIEFKTHFSYGFDDDEEIKTDDLKHLEPKLRDAWIEMRRLDKVLKRLSDKEKRVKMETKSMIEKYRIELDLLKMTSDRKESKQEQENTENYIALSYVDRKNELEDEEFDGESRVSGTDRESLTPLFKTQPEGFEQDDEDVQKTRATKGKQRNSVASSASSLIADNENLKASTSSLSKNSRLRSKSNGKASSINGMSKNKKDFIKRNIQLAQDAAGALAMTEDEKKRLDELLVEDDKNEKDFTLEYDEKTGMNNQIVDYNPFDVNLSAGDGFLPTLNDQQRLSEIDSRLEVRNYSRLMTGSRNAGTTSVSTLTSSMDPESFRNMLSVEQKKIKLNDDFDENEFGDKFIREARVSREQQTRLKFIDTQLDTMRSSSQATNDHHGDFSTQRTSSSNVSLIGQDQLQSLLDECSLSNKSVVSMIHNHKLGTVKEEDQIDDLGTIDEFNEEINEEVQINENVIKSLLEQAKNEGIVPLQIESDINEPAENTEPSFYEQAMQVLKERPAVLQQDFNIDVEPSDESSASDLKLPKLEDDSGQQASKMKLRRQAENANTFSRASSAASTINGDVSEARESITSPSQSFLPKIDTRFLPNNNTK